jgi:tripartite-type tricarboxylate transporter receptor subunit TctC
MTSTGKFVSIAAIGSIAICLTAKFAAAQDPTGGYFANRQVRTIVSTAAGGDYDVWMRIVTTHMRKYIPGAPTFVIQNMPGGGSIIATNYLANVAARDGSVIGMIGRNLPFQALMGERSIKFDLSKFNWIGNPETTNRVCVTRPTPNVKSAKDLFQHELNFGGAGAGGALSTVPQLLSRMLKMRLKLIEGYQGPQDVLLAIERGELDGVCTSVTGIESLRPGWMASGKLIVLFNMERDRLSDRGDVPSIYEFTSDEDERRLLTLFSAGVTFGRPIVAPPGVPAERVAVLRAAFGKAMVDPELLAHVKKLGLEPGVMTGEQLARLNAEVMATPRAFVERMKGYLK